MKHMTLTFRSVWHLGVFAAALFALTIAFSTPPVPVSAGNGFVVAIDSADVPPGGAVAVELNMVAPEPGLGSYAIDVVYNDSAVVLASCQSMLGGCNKVYGEGIVRIVGVPFSPIVGERTLATLVFEKTGGGNTDLDLQAANLYDGAGEDIAQGADVQDGSIDSDFTELDIPLGDANCDGRLNATDPIRILTEKAGGTASACLPYGDFNCDDHVDTLDVIALLMEFADFDSPTSCLT